MTWPRLAVLLIGLLVLVGAAHAPLHEEGEACSAWMLCSGALALCAVAARAPLGSVRQRAGRVRPQARRARRMEERRVAHGRAPPRHGSEA